MANLFSKKSVPLFNFVGISLGLCALLTVFVLFIKAKFLPPEIPLFYGLAQGESQLASTNLILLPVAISVCLLLANIIVSLFLKDDFLKKALTAAGILMITFSIITVIRIIFLVSSL